MRGVNRHGNEPLSIEDKEFDVWHIDSGKGEEEIERWVTGVALSLSTVVERGQIEGKEMVVDLARVGVSHHSFVTGDVWYQESFLRINVKMSVCTRGSSNNGWMCMDLPFGKMLVGEGNFDRSLIVENEQKKISTEGAYYWFVCCRMLLPPSTTSNECGQSDSFWWTGMCAINEFEEVIAYKDGFYLGFPRKIIGGVEFDKILDCDYGEGIVGVKRVRKGIVNSHWNRNLTSFEIGN
ncbi:hypothetical protein CXB51_020315 [Gossypium anomalum]|uniref:Uncharacterized protein n=1 Tax=Gossypium anomalum TaxID=47600 RepID=A0A8J5YBF8_9ROSI|nr:hypothetical protein CXB51_020315 [Gossypium anomalum]